LRAAIRPADKRAGAIPAGKHHPTKPSPLPLLFALDRKLNMENGFYYTTDCAELRKAGIASACCSSDFGSSDFGGSTSGMGGGD
jgi:hypothetical protein